MYELKSCPFCGEKDLCIEAGGIDYWVACNNCHALGPSGETEEDAVEAWNHRHEQPNPPLTLDELREMDGEPVWIESPDMPNLHGWAINYGLDPDVMHIQYAEISLDMYGKTWLAYRRRPEEEHNE